MSADRLHLALAAELARRGRIWGSLNERWLAQARDYSHGSPAFKWSGADPVGADAARVHVHRVPLKAISVPAAVRKPLPDALPRAHHHRNPR